MNEKHLLVNCITLLFSCSQLDEDNENFRSLAREVLSDIKLPEVDSATNTTAKVTGSLRQTGLWMATEGVRYKHEANELLQRLRLDTLGDNELYSAIERGIIADQEPLYYKERCLKIVQQLNEYNRERNFSELVRKSAYKLSFERDKIENIRHFAAELYSSIEPYQANAETNVDPAIVSSLDSNDLDSITTQFDVIEKMESGESILRTGWQGVNRMLRGGFRRGDEVVIGALQHNYKTGFSLSIFRQMLTYNKPYMLDPTKKPMMLRISFEDSLDMNVDYLYRSIKQNEYGSASGWVMEEDKDARAAYVKTSMESNGYEFRMMRVDPSQWGYRDICNEILRLEALGYEVHAVMLDYLAQVPTIGCTEGPTGTDIRDMYRRMRNFTNP